MKKRWYSFLVCVLFVVMGLSAQAWSKDEADIRGLIEKFSLMWTAEDGNAIFSQISATENFMHIIPLGPNSKTAFPGWLANVKKAAPSSSIPIKSIGSSSRIRWLMNSGPSK